MKQFFSEFKEFISRGNVVSMAVGIIVGGAFTSIVTALNDNILTPLLGVLFGGIDFSDIVFYIGQSPFKVGLLINAIINFLLISLVLFCIVKAMNTMEEKAAAKLKKKKEEEAAEPEKPDPQIVLLTEIRDLLEKDTQKTETQK